MSVLQRKELEESPLADLHAIASELGIERYRALRQADLVAAIVQAQGGDADAEEGATDGDRGDEPAPEEPAAAEPADKEPADEEPSDEEPAEPDAAQVSGILDVLQAGSGFLRVDEGDDVYVSPAQIRRCELRAGDEVAGPLRPARRNERHPSLVRVETVNGRDAEPPEERPRFADLTAVHPTERLAAPTALGSVPYGKGSRVAISGPPGAGGTRLLAEITEAVGKAGEELTLSVVLVGARPEELAGWREAGDAVLSGGSFDQPNDAQVQAAELAVERAKRVVERGGDAIVVLDSLSSMPPGAARRVFGAARKVEEGGSLTLFATIGTTEDPQRQASTHIALDAPGPDGAPRVSASRSRTQRSDLLR